MNEVQELKRVLRSLLRTPRASAIAVLTLALGIGACVAIFSVVHAVLLSPLPFPEPDSIVQMWQINDGVKNRFSDPNFTDIYARSRSFDALAQVQQHDRLGRGRLGARARARRGGLPGVFRRPRRGAFARTCLRGRGASRGWKAGRARKLWLLAALLGIRGGFFEARAPISGQSYAVVGVMPPELDFPTDHAAALWTARELLPRYPSRTAHNWRAVGRLKENVSLDLARSDVSTIARDVRSQLGEETWMTDAALVPLHEELVGDVRPAMLVLIGAVGFLLLVACANVVNLLLARAAARHRELAVSAALGASRWQLTRPFLLEALILLLVGGALGILGSTWGVRALIAFEPGKLPRALDVGVGVGVSVPMLAFALGVSLATAAGLGLTAALRATSKSLQESLRESQRGELGRASSMRARSILVVTQVALTLVLLVGAGLLARSLFQLLAVDPGFRAESQVVMELSHAVPDSEDDVLRLVRLQSEILERLRSVPGVSRAGGVDRLPMSTGFRNGLFLIVKPGERVETLHDFQRLAEDAERVGEAEYRAASDGFFQAMGIPLVRGRLFEDRDDRAAPHVAVISESLVRAKWSGQDPIGALIEFGNMDGDLRLLRVVGVGGDIRHGGLDTEARPTIYTNTRQRPPVSFTVVMDAGSPQAVMAAARRITHELAPDVPPRFSTMGEVFRGSVADRRSNLLLLSVFGANALALAIMGIDGVISYGVTQRRQELGVRVALGASQSAVLSLIVGQGLRLILMGIGVGVLVAAMLTRYLESLLFEVSAIDPVLFSVLALALGAVGLAACYLPVGRRRARIRWSR